MDKLSKKARDLLKSKVLESQDGKCAICLRGPFCAACHFNMPHIDGCNLQPVNTLDHNHSHKDCNGCEKCIRGITHPLCNRAITIIELNPHLQSDYMKNYLNKGYQE